MTDTMTDLRSIPFHTADGSETTLAEFGDSACSSSMSPRGAGSTPQYEQLEELQKTYGDRGLQVVGFPCNQFLQELSTNEAIAEYCSMTWGITFPIMDKVKVNGRKAAEFYKALKAAPNEEGTTGRIMWNFEKFLITPGGNVHRFSPKTKPDAPDGRGHRGEPPPLIPLARGLLAASRRAPRRAPPTPGGRSERTPRRLRSGYAVPAVDDEERHTVDAVGAGLSLIGADVGQEAF